MRITLYDTAGGKEATKALTVYAMGKQERLPWVVKDCVFDYLEQQNHSQGRGLKSHYEAGWYPEEWTNSLKVHSWNPSAYKYREERVHAASPPDEASYEDRRSQYHKTCRVHQREWEKDDRGHDFCRKCQPVKLSSLADSVPQRRPFGPTQLSRDGLKAST